MLSAKELEQLRAHAGGVLTDACTIQKPTETTNGIGERVPTYADTYTGVPCKLSAKAAMVGIEGGKIAIATQWMLSVRHDTDIDAGYRVVHNGVTYDVKSVMDDQSWVVLKRAELIRVV